MDNIVWIRWYKMYADGITPSTDDGYEYQWYKVPESGNMVELAISIETDLEESINFYEEGEHYRCFRWEFIDTPPRSYIDDMIKHHKRCIVHSTEMLKYYKGLVNEGE